MPIWPFRRSRAREDAEALLAAVTAVSRNPAFFGEGRVPDTLQGRFELMTLNAILALVRLGPEPDVEPLAQAFTDQLFDQFDAGLREEGVGDTAVPKRMHKLAGDFYGRLGAYAEAISARDEAALAAAMGRNVLGAEDHPFAGSLAAYALRTATHQAEAPVESLHRPEGWPSPGG